MSAFSAYGMKTSESLPAGDGRPHGAELVIPLVPGYFNQQTHAQIIKAVPSSLAKIGRLASVLRDPGETVAKDTRRHVTIEGIIIIPF